jgi:hypothetical protein
MREPNASSISYLARETCIVHLSLSTSVEPLAHIFSVVANKLSYNSQYGYAYAFSANLSDRLRTRLQSKTAI